MECYAHEKLRYFKSTWPALPCFQIVVSPGKIAKTDVHTDPQAKARGYPLWQTKKGGKLLACLFSGCGRRVSLTFCYDDSGE